MVLPPSEVRWQDNPALAAASTALWRPGQPLILAHWPSTHVRPHTETGILTWNTPPISAAEMVCLSKSQLSASEYARDTLPPQMLRNGGRPRNALLQGVVCLRGARNPQQHVELRRADRRSAFRRPVLRARPPSADKYEAATNSAPAAGGGADRETLPALPSTPPARQYGASPAAYPGRGGRSRATGIRESERVTHPSDPPQAFDLAAVGPRVDDKLEISMAVSHGMH